MNTNVIKIITVSTTVLLLLILPACNMTPADSLFTSMAQGSKLRAEYAIASGVMAAEAIKEARKKGDFSSRTLAHYEDLLRDSFLLKELETFRHAFSILKNPRWFSLYPQAICELYEKLMWIDENPKPRLFSTAYGELRKSILSLQGIKDILSLRRI